VIERTWTATDACYNSSYCVQKITVKDTKAPYIKCPDDITIKYGESTEPSNTGKPEVKDNCDAYPDVNYTDKIIPGDCKYDYVIERTWTATDACKNSSYCVQKIKVEGNCVYAGCSQGYWKNHTESWDTPTDPYSTCIANAVAAKGYSGDGTTSALFKNIFGLSDAQMTTFFGAGNENMTLLQANQFTGGGDIGVIARDGVAALLNSCALSSPAPLLPYPYTTTQVLTMVHDAVAGNSAQPAAGNLSAANDDDASSTVDCPLGNTSIAGIASETVQQKSDKATVRAYPNPYKDLVNFTIKSPVSGKASLEIYNMVGQKLAIVFQGNLKAGDVQNVQYNVPIGNRVSLVYKLTVGNQSFRGVLLPLK